MDLSRKYKTILTGLMLVVLITITQGTQAESSLPEIGAAPAVLLAQTNTEAENTNEPNKEYRESDISPKPFDRDVWNKKRDGIDYSSKKKETDEVESEDDKSNKNKKKQEENDSSNSGFDLNLGPFGQFLLIAIVLGVLALLVFVLVKLGLLDGNTSISQGNQGPVLLDEIEDNLHESDLEKALRLALEAKDYRLAIRIYYLSIIKELSIRDWIKWKRDKTNGQYVREMVERPEGKTFRQLTIAFERAWYSDEEVVLRHYEVLSPQFELFMNNLKKR